MAEDADLRQELPSDWGRPRENGGLPTLALSDSGKKIDGRKRYAKQVTGRHNDTELHVAVKKGDLEGVKEVLNAHADEEMRSKLVSEVNELGETPLHVAAEGGHLEVLKELLKFAPPDCIARKNLAGYDVFHISAKEGHLGL